MSDGERFELSEIHVESDHTHKTGDEEKHVSNSENSINPEKAEYGANEKPS
jgi:hypothetical protein